MLLGGCDQRIGQVLVPRGQNLCADRLDRLREAALPRVGRDRHACSPGSAGVDRRCLGQRDRPERRQLTLRLDEGPPVEGLEHASIRHSVLLNHAEHFPRERDRIDGVRRHSRIDLRLDVELDVVGAVAVRQSKNLRERRHPRSGHGLLCPDERVGQRQRVTRPAVELLDLRERQVLDQRADPRPLALERRDAPLVTDDHDTVLRDPRIELERRHADLQCLPECGERVLGAEPARAPMTLDVEVPLRLCGRRGGARGCERHDGEHCESRCAKAQQRLSGHLSSWPLGFARTRSSTSPCGRR